jgi:iron(III) transport system substrate-binding protein
MTDRSWRRATGSMGILIAIALMVGACSTAGVSSAPSSAATLPPAGPSTAPSAAPSSEPIGGSLTVYNAQHESLTQAWVDEFTRQTGVQVTLRNGDDAELGNLLVQEGAASPADVFLTENSPAMALVENVGLFAPVDQATLDQVPTAYRPSTGAWTGIAARTTVFAYNPTLLTPDRLPASLLDLQNAEWKGRWAASPSGADFQAIVSALLALKGEAATTAWLAGMKTNATAYQGNTTVMKAVNAGEIPGGVIYHYYWFGDQAKTKENSKNVSLHYFKHQDPGAFISVSGGGVLKSSTNAAAAQAFLRFITGTAGQTILQTGTSFEYAIASDVAGNPALVPLVDLEAPTVDPSSLDSKKVTDLMTQAGIL